MNDLTTISRVRALLGDALGVPAHTITDEQTLGALDMDSIDIVQLAIDVETHFDVEVPPDAELTEDMTPPTLAALVDRLLADKAALPATVAL